MLRDSESTLSNDGSASEIPTSGQIGEADVDAPPLSETAPLEDNGFWPVLQQRLHLVRLQRRQGLPTPSQKQRRQKIVEFGRCSKTAAF